MPKVSVIIPVYNTEKYLQRCLDSVCSQTLKNIEIICVNDCSTDNCVSLLEQYAKNDTRITVINFENNKGGSVARNCGMKIATGEYISFIDSDDYISFNYFEELYACAIRENAQICKALTIQKSVDYKYTISLQHIDIEQDKRNFSFEFFSAIYLRSMLEKNSILFPEGILVGEDVIFLMKAVYCATKVSTCDNIFYRYMRREDSADSVKYSKEKFASILQAQKKIATIINTFENNYDDYAKKYAYLIHFTITRSNRAVEDCKDIAQKEACRVAIEIYNMRKPNALLHQEIIKIFRNSIMALYYLHIESERDLVEMLSPEYKPTSQQKILLELRAKTALRAAGFEF